MSQNTQDPGLRAATIPCPTCSCTGTDTYEDRHTGTNMDTCRTCGGNGYIAARTGETPEASYQPALSATPADAPGKAGDREGLPKITEAADTPASTGPADLALTCEWPCGRETTEFVSYEAAALLGYRWPDEAALAPSPTGNEAPRGVVPAGWYTKNEQPDVGRKLIALWDDGSGAALLYRHDEGFIDSDGDDYQQMNGSLDRWAYLPNDFEFHCELVSEPGEPPMHLPVAAAPPPPVSTEPDSAAGAEREALKKVAFWLKNYPGNLIGVGSIQRVIAEALAALHPSPPTASGAAAPVGERCGYTECAALGRTVCEDCRDLATPTPAPHPVPAGQTTGEVPSEVEAMARSIAAEKIGSADPTGARLPADIWEQALPEAQFRISVSMPPQGDR